MTYDKGAPESSGTKDSSILPSTRGTDGLGSRWGRRRREDRMLVDAKSRFTVLRGIALLVYEVTVIWEA
jgi:hypothetical protein